MEQWSQAEYEQAVAALTAASAAYYGAGDTVMSDAEYDRLLAGVAAFEAEHGIAGGVAGTIAVGAAPTGQVTHTVPMLSLDNVYTEDTLDAWRATVSRELGHEPEMTAEPKLDGMAMSLEYEQGRLVRMSTRGDGMRGEDMTAAAKLIDNIPTTALMQPDLLARGAVAFTGEVRGEVIFSHTQFEVANRLRCESGKPPFANPRNAVVGTLRRAADWGDAVGAVKVSFVAYDVVGLRGWRRYDQVMQALTRAGFTTALSLINTRGISLDRKPEGVPFDMDGVVFKVVEYGDRERLGATGRAPRWARAYKYPPDVENTRLLDVTWQVGRTGYVTPRAILTPVKVGGTTITFATLNNPADILRKGVMIGDMVQVRRAGEVIPEILGAVTGLRDGTETPVAVPETCPNCGEALETTSVKLRCPSHGTCSLVQRIEYAVSTDALDVDGLSTQTITKLVDTGLVTNLANLFAITADDLEPIVGAKLAAKLAANLASAPTRTTFDRVLIALSLHGTGRAMCRRLAAHFGSWEELSSASVDELTAVDGIGTAKAASLHGQIRDVDPLVRDLAFAGFPTTASTDSPTATAGPLAGQVIVLTGSLDTLGPRSKATAQLTTWGAEVSSSVTSTTTMVLAADPNGTSSKLVKARRLGVRIVTEVDLLAMIGA